jgi:hypothetical protein
MYQEEATSYFGMGSLIGLLVLALRLEFDHGDLGLKK